VAQTATATVILAVCLIAGLDPTLQVFTWFMSDTAIPTDTFTTSTGSPITMDGIRSYPEQMEHVLTAHPRVANVAVLGPRPELPAELTAVVQPVDWPTSGELSDELTQFCDDRLPPPQAPIRIRFTEHLPRAATGKLYRNQIELP